MNFSFFLKTIKLVHFLSDNSRLFHRIAAVFLKHLLPYVTLCIFCIPRAAEDSCTFINIITTHLGV